MAKRKNKEKNKDKDKINLFDEAINAFYSGKNCEAFDKFYQEFQNNKTEMSKCFALLTSLKLAGDDYNYRCHLITTEPNELIKTETDNIPLDTYSYLCKKIENEDVTIDAMFYKELGWFFYTLNNINPAIQSYHFALNRMTLDLKSKENVFEGLMLCYEINKDYEFSKYYAVILHNANIDKIYYLIKLVIYNTMINQEKYKVNTSKFEEIKLEIKTQLASIKKIYSNIKDFKTQREICLSTICNMYFYLDIPLDTLYENHLSEHRDLNFPCNLKIVYAYNELINNRLGNGITTLKNGLDIFNNKVYVETLSDQSKKYYTDYLNKIFYLNLLINFSDNDLEKYISELSRIVKEKESELLKDFAELLYNNIYLAKIKCVIKYNKIEEVGTLISEIIDRFNNYELFKSKDLLDSLLYACCAESKLDLFRVSMTYIRENRLTSNLSDNIFNKIISTDDKIYINYLDIFLKCIEIKSICSIRLDKELDNTKELGHYTNIDSVKYLVKNNNSARIRMYNADYMNDPDEGKLIFDKLDFNVSYIENLDLETNPYFLFCMSKKDSLPLWVGYAKDGNGCFLQLKKESLVDNSSREFISISENNNNSYSIRLEKESSIRNNKIDIESPIKHNVAKPYKYDDIRIYRVCYINKNSKDTNITKNEELNTLILDLIKLVEKPSNEEDRLLFDILDEIRFLFKSSDYSAEEEIRIIKNVKDKNQYILDDRDSLKFPKLYVQIENSKGIQFEEVMIGPKVSDEDKTLLIPYLKYCKNVDKVSYSDIKYR